MLFGKSVLCGWKQTALLSKSDPELSIKTPRSLVTSFEKAWTNRQQFPRMFHSGRNKTDMH